MESLSLMPLSVVVSTVMVNEKKKHKVESFIRELTPSNKSGIVKRANIENEIHV